jgi:hypothetical protein
MDKKSINRKTVKQFIIDNRNNGKTDQEIYDELAPQYFDKKTIALLITGTVKPEIKKKYKQYNNILLGLLILTVLLKILTVIIWTIQVNQPLVLIFIFILPLFNIYFIYEISRYNAPIYRLCGIMSIVSILYSFTNAQNGIDIFVTILVSGAIAGFSFYLNNSMFPNNNPKDLIKDINGEYRFD